MFWERNLSAVFQSARRQFPAVFVTGPRQSGKTTFLQHVASEAAYVSFDDPLTRQFATIDRNGFLAQIGERPVEIKKTATPLPGHASGLLRFRELLGPEAGARGSAADARTTPHYRTQ